MSRRLKSIAELSTVPGPVVLCIGVFDGVHLGHQQVITEALADARSISGSAVVMTFDPHPARVLRPDKAPRLLTSTEHKLRLLAALGVENLLVVRFDQEFAEQDPATFVRSIAGAAKPLRQIAVGEQWAFGRGRSGNVELLRGLGDQMGFEVIEMRPVELDGEIVSSTRIRRAVEMGDLDTARRCLGRDFTILGTVEEGLQIGRELGFPTANLRAHNEQFPPDGVWAVRCDLEGEQLAGVANIGYRPTLSHKNPERKLEVHLFDFERPIYGRDIEVTFVKHLRGEIRFDGLDALKDQIARDVQQARVLLAANPA